MSSIPFGVPPIPVSASTSLAHSRRFSNLWSQAELTGLPQGHARIPSTEEREPFCIDLRRSQSQGSRANAVDRLVDIVHIEPQSESDDDKYIRQLCARLVDTSVYRQALSEWGGIELLEKQQEAIFKRSAPVAAALAHHAVYAASCTNPQQRATYHPQHDYHGQQQSVSHHGQRPGALQHQSASNMLSPMQGHGQSQRTSSPPQASPPSYLPSIASNASLANISALHPPGYAHGIRSARICTLSAALIQQPSSSSGCSSNLHSQPLAVAYAPGAVASPEASRVGIADGLSAVLAALRHAAHPANMSVIVTPVPCNGSGGSFSRSSGSSNLPTQTAAAAAAIASGAQRIYPRGLGSLTLHGTALQGTSLSSAARGVSLRTPAAIARADGRAGMLPGATLSPRAGWTAAAVVHTSLSGAGASGLLAQASSAGMLRRISSSSLIGSSSHTCSGKVSHALSSIGCGSNSGNGRLRHAASSPGIVTGHSNGVSSSSSSSSSTTTQDLAAGSGLAQGSGCGHGSGSVRGSGSGPRCDMHEVLNLSLSPAMIGQQAKPLGAEPGCQGNEPVEAESALEAEQAQAKVVEQTLAEEEDEWSLCLPPRVLLSGGMRLGMGKQAHASSPVMPGQPPCAIASSQPVPAAVMAAPSVVRALSTSSAAALMAAQPVVVGRWRPAVGTMSTQELWPQAPASTLANIAGMPERLRALALAQQETIRAEAKADR